MKNKSATAMLILIPAFVLVVIIIVQNNSMPTQRDTITLSVSGKTIEAKVADTPIKRSKGLMFIKSLGENEGMFFIFEQSSMHSFWMKNTFLPLDIIWLDENFKVADIKKAAPICNTEDCPSYAPSAPAKYVLELNAGWADANSLKVGDTVSVANK